MEKTYTVIVRTNDASSVRSMKADTVDIAGHFVTLKRDGEIVAVVSQTNLVLIQQDEKPAGGRE